MKLAEALIKRADLQKRIEQLRARLSRNVKVQEGDAPAEDPDKLLDELENLISELEILIRRINKTNSKTQFDDARTITDILAERDSLLLKRTIYGDIVETASIKQDRYTRSEVKFKSTINVSEIQKEIDSLSKQHRELDADIQRTNWNVDLIDL